MEKDQEGRIYQLPVEMDELYEGLDDIEMGPRWMGEKIRKADMLVELGGPRHDYRSWLFTEIVKSRDEVRDGEFELIGPDITEIEPESSYPFGWHFKLFGRDLTDDYTEVCERYIHTAVDQIERVMLINARHTIWIRFGKGIEDRISFHSVAQTVNGFLRTVFPLVEAVEIRFIIGSEEVGGLDRIAKVQEKIKPIWHALDSKYMDLEDDDVDAFYGCTVCQTFAPNHVCVITPSRIPYCGILSYHGAKTTMEVDPHGFVFEIPKGKCLDPVFGRYTGVDEKVFEKSNYTHKRVYLHSCLKYVQTNCGCFEAIAFYIPEVDGIGIVHRRFPGETPMGLTFPKIASIISGGAQNHGFLGISVRGIRQPAFLQGDGGWDRIVWMPKDVKIEISDGIPEEIYEKIATEEDTIDPLELKAFLEKKRHPIIEKYWKNRKPQPLDVPPAGADWEDELET
jgi:acetyl-CoA decarbonylase/synthase complex subunit beta